MNARKFVKSYCERVWNEFDLTAIDEFCSQTTRIIEPHREEVSVTREELKERVREVLSRIPDHFIDILSVYSDGESIFFSWRVRGHWHDGLKGDFPVDFVGVTYWRLESGLIAVRDGVADSAAFAWQTKALSSPLGVHIPV